MKKIFFVLTVFLFIGVGCSQVPVQEQTQDDIVQEKMQMEVEVVDVEIEEQMTEAMAKQVEETDIMLEPIYGTWVTKAGDVLHLGTDDTWYDGYELRNDTVVMHSGVLSFTENSLLLEEESSGDIIFEYRIIDATTELLLLEDVILSQEFKFFPKQ